MDDNNKIENFLEQMIFHSRWLLAPFYLALIGGIVVLFVKLIKEFGTVISILMGGEGNAVLSILSLVDITLIANLLVIVIFSGYENFISKLDVAHNSPDKPSWMGKVTYADLKLKLIGSIVAISAIDLLKAFVNIQSTSHEDLAWLIGIHMTFLVSGVLFALMDKLSGKH
ncbi:TIGR00645 family protein [Chitinivorax sp. B]|uniref:TIGR00645 family protein n=1 Tax=Chitinivorax sp. B TaxID=2502235 RepID=UPI0010F7D54B|nr:TIGR00645 family protein [Chitinivorax sp. B]